jgi:hypothetical protein
VCTGAKYDVPVQFVAVAKPFKHQLGVVSSLLSLNWELYDDVVIGKSPLYLRDGDLMLWRDLREIPKELVVDGSATQVPCLLHVGLVRSLINNARCVCVRQVSGSCSRPRESGIVIRTVHDLPPAGCGVGDAKEELQTPGEAGGDVPALEPAQ